METLRKSAACYVLCGGLAFLGILNGGCQHAAPPATAPPADSAVVLTSPGEAADSLLHFLRAQLAAVAQRDPNTARAARDQVVWHILAREDILVRAGRDAAQQQKVLDECVESWAAALAYYADGLQPDSKRIEPGQATGQQVVLFTARGLRHAAVVRITCVPAAAGRWRVRALDFLPATTHAAPAPATGPTTRP